MTHAAAPRAASDTKIVVQRFSGQAGFSAVRDDWDRLVKRMRSPRHFHLPIWYQSYLEALEPQPERVHFFGFYRGGVLLGIFPLKVEQRSWRGISVRSLELPQHHHLNLCDVVMERSAENRGLLGILIDHLRNQHDVLWDVISLRSTPEDSAAAFIFSAEPAVRTLRVPRGVSRWVPCAPYATPTDRMSSRFRHNLQRLSKRAGRLGALEFRTYRTPAEVSGALPIFVAVEASGWKGDQGSGSAIGCQAPVRAFYERLMNGCEAPANSVVNLLWLEQTCIAGQLAVIVDGVMNVIKIGYLEAHRELAPGNLLMQRVLEQCDSDPAIRKVSLGTDPPWSHSWRAQAHKLYDFHVFNTTWRSRAVQILRRGVTMRDHLRDLSNGRPDAELA